MIATRPSVPSQLRQLRTRAGLSMEDMARALGYKGASGYQRYEDPNLFKKPFLPYDLVTKLSEVITGRGDPPIEEHEILALAGLARGADLKPRMPKKLEAVEHPTDDGTTGDMIEVDEIDARAGAGGGGAIDYHVALNGDTLTGVIPRRYRWAMPRDVARHVTDSPAEAIKIITIVGNSMVPDLMPGQRIMVDTNDRTPSPPGIFVVWDGMSLVAKIVEYIPFSEPPRVKIKSKNADYDTYERTLDEAYIQGRVIGTWQWT